MRIGIDATNIGLGGGITHLIEILNIWNKETLYSDSSIVVFSSSKVLNELPNDSRIKKLTHRLLNKSLIHRLIFQLTLFDKIIQNNCDVLFSITGDYTGNFRPVVSMSRNMLLYERSVWTKMIGYKEVLKFWLKYKKQVKCFKNSEGIIFISEFARRTILEKLKLESKKIKVINHGISDRFFINPKPILESYKYSKENPLILLYVSTVHMYKNQWNVVKAVANLREKGYSIKLNLVGNIIYKPAGKLLDKTLKDLDSGSEFVSCHHDVKYNSIHKFYEDSDAIVFASILENMPNILMESMAAGRPIACSQSNPMPEFLKENGYYFDALDSNSIEQALEKLIINVENSNYTATLNIIEAKKFSWELTAKSTYDFICQINESYYMKRI